MDLHMNHCISMEEEKRERLTVQKIMITMKTTLIMALMKTLISMSSLLEHKIAQPTKYTEGSRLMLLLGPGKKLH